MTQMSPKVFTLPEEFPLVSSAFLDSKEFIISNCSEAMLKIMSAKIDSMEKQETA